MFNGLKAWIKGEEARHPHVAAVLEHLASVAGVSKMIDDAKAAVEQYGLPYLQHVTMTWLAAHGVTVAFAELIGSPLAKVAAIAEQIGAAVSEHGAAYVEQLVQSYLQAIGLPVTALGVTPPSAPATAKVNAVPVEPPSAPATAKVNAVPVEPPSAPATAKVNAVPVVNEPKLTLAAAPKPPEPPKAA